VVVAAVAAVAVEGSEVVAVDLVEVVPRAGGESCVNLKKILGK
jgi:hypothetical protein